MAATNVDGAAVQQGRPFLKVIGAIVVLGAAAIGVAVAVHRSRDGDAVAPATTDLSATVTTQAPPATSDAVTTQATDSGGTEPPTSTTTVAPAVAPTDGKTSADRRLENAFTITNADLQPKSIVASGGGLFFAQNMMYRHNVMVFDRDGKLVAKISDKVDLAAFGVAGGVTAQGAPVEAAFTPDGATVYVSNYKMYGPGYHPVADDNCNRGKWDDSFVYKINTKTFTIDKVIETGAVPKFLAVTPDGSKLLVSNWCGFDVSVIDTATDTQIARIDVGRHPRGIAITTDSLVAYVAVMGEAKIVKIDLRTNTVVGRVADAGATPRHLLLSPDNHFLYVSNNQQNTVRKIDLKIGAQVGIAHTGTETRSMALADDGESLYVVNYQDGTVSKVRTSDMKILQTEHTGVHPVGITYDPVTRQVWVANYTGSLRVFVDR